MKNIIRNVLCELNFVPGESFTVESDSFEYTLFPFYQKNTAGQVAQVYLLTSLLESDVIERDLRGDFSYISSIFRKIDAYEPEMEKNTSIVLCVMQDIQSERMKQIQIDIEDDPYFFKKYIFCYLNDEPSIYEQIKKEYGYEPSQNLSFIQEYILNQENFQRFKANSENETMYRFISDLIIKIPVIPIEFRTSESLYTVGDFFNDEIIAGQAQILDDVVSLLSTGEDHDQQELIDTLYNIASAMGES